MTTPSNPLPYYPRWLMNDHDLTSLFNSQLSTGAADAVTQRIRREPATLTVLLELLGDPRTALSTRIGIGVVMEELASSPLLQQQVPALCQLTRHKDARIRADACHYLGLSGADSAIACVEICLNDPEQEVRDVAADALQQLGRA